MQHYVNKETVFLNYIIGIGGRMEEPAAFEINCSNPMITNSTYSLSVEVSPKTKLTYLQLSFIIFNPKMALFSSGGGFLPLENF